MKCLRKVNGSKIKSKRPIEQFLAQCDSEEVSFSTAALDLPLPPPQASDFPVLPRAAPAPKMTKAEKAMANKINALLLSNDKADVKPVLSSDTSKTHASPGKGLPKPAAIATLLGETPPFKLVPAGPAPATSMQPAGVIPIPTEIRGEVFQASPEASSQISPDQSGAATPIMAMAAIHAVHAVSCPHVTDACSACRFGITCCKCQVMHTAPAAKRMRCTKCLHWACDHNQANECCLCSTPWVPCTIAKAPTPTSSQPTKLAERLRGGAGSEKAWSDDSAHTAEEDSTVKIQVAAPTQESIDEIDALSRPSTVQSAAEKGKRRKPKSGQSSREPSRPSSVASELLSVTETVLPKPDVVAPPLAHEYQWSKPPSDLKTLPGYVHTAHKEKVLQIDNEDPTHFVKRGSVDINALSEELDVLLSSTTSWKTIYHAITDLFQFDSIEGSQDDFICLLIGLARSWDSDAECRPAEVVKTLLNDASALVRTEEELHGAQTTLSRIRNERNQALTDVKKLSETCDRLRRDRNHLKAAMEDIVKSGGGVANTVQFEALQEEVALLKDEKAGLNKIIEHDKAALRTAEEENTAMTLQISLMNEDFDDKNAVIEALESTSVEMMKEHANLELLHLSAKAELEASKSVITTMKVQHDAEQKVYESRIQCLKSRASTDGADVNSSISRELAIAKERIAFLEKAYKEKSETLKRASQEKKKLTSPNPPKQTAGKTSNAPKWGFEPPDDLPMSQPYWDYRNAYSDHIAAMVTAMVTAIPHIPLSSAISSAISTVSKAGPLPDLAKGNKSKASRSSSPAPSRTPPPVIPKPSPPPVFNYSKLTMAQVVAGGASFSGGSEASAVNAAKEKKKYTWRALETSKQIMTKPGARGTRASELHLRIPRCPATAELYKASGSRLINAVIGILNKNANSDEVQAYKANPITSAKWSARSNLLLKCAQPLGEMLKVAIERSIRKDIPEGQVDEDSEVEVLNRPPTTSLKFMAGPRFNEDGSPTDSADLYSDIKANSAWADVSFFSDPKFLSKDREAASGIVVLTIVDDEQGNVGRRLMRSVVSFSGATRPCLRWVDKQVQPFCGQCMMWGHGGYNCTSNVLRCSKCGEGHDYKNHERFCDTCKKGAGHICVPKCFNCLGNHFATSKDCEFYRKRTDRQWQIDTFKAKHPSDNTKKRRDENRARNKAANNTPEWVRKRMAGDYSAGPPVDDGGFTKVLKKHKKVTFPDEGIARIDAVSDDWDADNQRQGSISPITYIDEVIASHAPEHMKDASVKTKSRHVEEEVSRIKKRLEEFRNTSQWTRESDAVEKAEQAPSPSVIDLVTPENQAGSPEVPLL
ncbi:hypothetical protein AX14_013475 [Amanita brunnescens Koide BX004]|nr:hypothetical protein AX14_013475 [Amanita brunnescens Koide BX004]